MDTWGKGKSNTETDQHYSQWKKVNRSIGNVSSPAAILDSFSKLIEGMLNYIAFQEKKLNLFFQPAMTSTALPINGYLVWKVVIG